MLSWLHIGDLHAAAEDGWRSVDHLAAIVDTANRELRAQVDFAFLPGDNANHGTADQCRRIRAALSRLRLPWHAIPGDHDAEPGDLGAFRDGLDARPLPRSEWVRGHRCLFLDLVSAGSGGPDFRLGSAAMRWLASTLEATAADAERPVVFQHAFPGDVADAAQAEAMARLYADHHVACVDTGHTHYNELLNDGSVIYAATRSTGQVEEGPVGYSLHTVDGSVVAWRFKALERPWPLAMITAPADVRLIRDPQRRDQVPGPRFAVRAQVFGTGVERVGLAVDGGPVMPMRPVDAPAGRWEAEVDGLADGDHRLEVTAVCTDGRSDADRTVVRVSAAAPARAPERRARLGHDIHTVGAWPERGLLGTQLGPNRNGRAW